MPKPAPHKTQLTLCVLAGMAMLAGASSADKRPTTEPGAEARPGPARIAEARAPLAGGIAPPAKLTAAAAKRIKELIEKLGDPVWKVRQAASAELLKSGPEILPLLIEASKHKDLEVSDRVGVIIKAIQARNMVLLMGNTGSKTITAVTLQGKIVWSRTMLSTPLCATVGRNGNIIVGYSAGSKPNVEEYNPKGKAVWTPTGVSNAAGSVFDVARLPNGNTLIAYSHHSGHVTEFDAKGKVVWRKKGLDTPFSVQRLDNGNTLIAEYAAGQVIEVDSKGTIVWRKTGLNYPTDAVKLPNGNVLISEHAGKRVLEVDRAGKVVWQRICPGPVTGLCRLPDGTIAISNQIEGTILLGRNGKKIRTILAHNAAWAKIRLVPADCLKRK